MAHLLLIGLIGLLAAVSMACADQDESSPTPVIGDEPAVARHISQDDIDAGEYDIEELIEHGRMLFEASFNTLDGAGRPELTGDGTARGARSMPQNFNRISGPDANSCLGCHNLPSTGGGGDNVANVFTQATENPFVDFDGDIIEGGPNQTLMTVGNERGTVGMFGSGLVELLAREMTVELHTARDLALTEAAKSGQPVSVELTAKGIGFGNITCYPDGSMDTGEVDGVDEDLIIRPFSQKGAVVSLREFTNNAALTHHGITSNDRTGEDRDPDFDTRVNEMTVGDITALTLFQATLPAPVEVTPATEEEREAAALGRELFSSIGCSSCHVPALPLSSTEFTEPGPYNPLNQLNKEDDLRPEDVPDVIRVDLAEFAEHLKKDKDKNYLVPVFSDLKRHDMGEFLNNESIEQDFQRRTAPLEKFIPTQQWMTRKLWGFASEPPFLHHGRATLISEAILATAAKRRPQGARSKNCQTTSRRQLSSSCRPCESQTSAVPSTGGRAPDAALQSGGPCARAR